MMSIMDDELDIDTAQSKEDKDHATRSKASKTWRILRLSSRSKLAAFDKIDDGKNLNALFETPPPPEGTPQPSEKAETAEPLTQAPGDVTKETEGGNGGNADEQPPESGIEKGDTTMADQPPAESPAAANQTS